MQRCCRQLARRTAMLWLILRVAVCCTAESFVISDTLLPALHLLLALHDRGSPVCVLVLPLVSMMACAQALQTSTPPAAAASPPAAAPLMIDGHPSPIRLFYCTRWAQVAAAATSVRVFHVPSMETCLGTVACESDQRQLLARMLSYFPHAQLFPPTTWDELFEPKDEVYAAFGDEFMLPALWVPLPSLKDVQRVAAQILSGRSDGQYMLKGRYSHGAITAMPFTVTNGRCSALPGALGQLFTEHHQRCVGVQPYEPKLRDLEQRVFLVLNPGAAAGEPRWTQAVHVRTQFRAGGHCAWQSSPVHGPALQISNFIQALLKKRPERFEQAADLGIPMLRLDCSITSGRPARCFLNELAASDVVMFTGVHWQELALHCGKSYAASMWDMLQR